MLYDMLNHFTKSESGYAYKRYAYKEKNYGIQIVTIVFLNLQGISINADPLMNSKTEIMVLTSYLKEHNKLLFSWGAANCHGEYAEIQKSVQMAGVISDK